MGKVNKTVSKVKKPANAASKNNEKLSPISMTKTPKTTTKPKGKV